MHREKFVRGICVIKCTFIFKILVKRRILPLEYKQTACNQDLGYKCTRIFKILVTSSLLIINIFLYLSNGQRELKMKLKFKICIKNLGIPHVWIDEIYSFIFSLNFSTELEEIRFNL